MKKYLIIFFCLVLVVQTKAQNFDFQRFKKNPIIHAGLLPAGEGDNINGPTLIKVPDWVQNKLGKYYLYFAHHKGKYIRLAYSDNLQGPWKIYKPGTLQLEECICKDAPFKKGQAIGQNRAENADDEVQHVASPEILIDEVKKEFILYYHCPLEYQGKKGQFSLSAVSKDGLHFKSDDLVLGDPYFRVFQWKNTFYAWGRSNSFFRSNNPRTSFEKGPNPFLKIQKPSQLRHTGLKLVGDTLWVFYSRVGDAPERILLSKIHLTDNWNDWTPTDPVTIVSPTEKYEGGELPIEKSEIGLYHGLTRQLRDPFLFEEKGKWYLLYSVAGESGIGIGELKFHP